MIVCMITLVNADALDYACKQSDVTMKNGAEIGIGATICVTT